MDYDASWRNTGPFGVAVAVGSLLIVALGLAASRAELVWVGGAGIGWLALIGWRLRLRIDEEGLASRGWVDRGSARWGDVSSITNATRLPWPGNRGYGPLVFEVRTASGRLRINFLYFDPAAFRAFRAAIERHGIDESKS